MNNFRRTKIIATVGPSSSSEEKIEALIKSGVNIFRLNFSHATHEEHGKNIRNIKKISQLINIDVAIMADLKGPEIRTDLNTYSIYKDEPVCLRYGQGDIANKIIGVSHNKISQILKKNDIVLVDDGFLTLNVIEVKNNIVKCLPLKDGIIKPRKSINIPGVDIGLPILEQKDREDLHFIAKQDVDWIAVSFVGSGEDIQTVRSFLNSINCDYPLLSKIESSRSVKPENLDDIIDLSDGVMVARGDLGVELATEEVPFLQNQIIKKTKTKGKVVVVATQMLESMTKNTRPTRSEATDVYNAAINKVDALMLSGETAAGEYPVEAVKMMDRIICSAQRHQDRNVVEIGEKNSIYDISKAAVELGCSMNAKALITISLYGKSTHTFAAFRSNIPIFIVFSNKNLAKRSILYYSIYPIFFEQAHEEENGLKGLFQIEERLKDKDWLSKGDNVVLVYPYPSLTKDASNTIINWTIK